jgi:hypothetical protein
MQESQLARSRVFGKRKTVVLIDVRVLVRRDSLEQSAQTFVWRGIN